MSNELLIGKDYKNNLSIKNKLGRLIWTICYWILFRPFPTRIFSKWRCILLRLFGAKIGKNNTIYPSAKVWAPWNLIIGNNSCISNGVNLYNPGKIVIGDNVVISEKAFICTPSHDITDKNFPLITTQIEIKNNSWVAAEAFVGPGVAIGEGAVIGARAAVFKDVEPWSVVGGNPAVFLKKRVIKE